ncbi:MAG: SDR family NAD(P)-dependent oxidoreductase [Caulobacteraceae bacterium]
MARQLALEGVRVAIAARDLAATERAAAELSAETGGEIYGFSADTGDDGSVKALIAAVAVRLGGIDILVNAAAKPGGGGPPPKLAEVTDDLFWSDVNVKVMGYLRVAREAARPWRWRLGRIIIVLAWRRDDRLDHRFGAQWRNWP